MLGVMIANLALTCALGLGFYFIDKRARERSERIELKSEQDRVKAEIHLDDKEANCYALFNDAMISVMKAFESLHRGIENAVTKIDHLADEQLAQHQQAATVGEDQHDEVLGRIASVLDAVTSQAQELKAHADQVTAHAKQIIDARNQQEGNVHVPRVPCTQCQRIVFRYAMLDGKAVCQDCISQGKGIPVVAHQRVVAKEPGFRRTS